MHTFLKFHDAGTIPAIYVGKTTPANFHAVIYDGLNSAAGLQSLCKLAPGRAYYFDVLTGLTGRKIGAGSLEMHAGKIFYIKVTRN